MLSISPPLTTPDYVLSLAAANYYTEGGEPLGRWYGDGCKALHLSGNVQPKVLRRLFAGLSPDRKTRLVQEVVVEGRKRQSGWDLTFSAEKSVSVLWAVSNSEMRRKIEAAHERAVHRALDFIQKEAGLTRRGKGSKRIEPASLVWAMFAHGTSRSNQPQLHTHCLLLNLGIRADGTTGSIVTKEIFRLKMIAGLIYRQEFGHLLTHELGLSLKQERSWFSIEGVSKFLITRFSSRRIEILAHLEKMGKSDAKSAAHAAKATRKEKECAPRKELFEEWERIAREEFGFTPEKAASLCGTFQPSRKPLGLAASIDDLLRQGNFFTERQLVRRVLERNQATGHSADHILKAVRLALGKLVNLGIHNGQRLFTTESVLREERLLIAIAEAGANRTRLVVRSGVALKAAKDMNQEQADALLHLVSSRGMIKILEGRAGSGKSRLLGAARKAWEQEGFAVIGGAFSGKAADELQKSSGISSHTIDRLLNQWSKPQSAVRRLGPKTVLVVDEAGMLDVFKLRKLVDLVFNAGAKLVLVGDSKQLPPISGAAPFAELGKVLGKAELTEILRQKDGLLKLMVEDLADGDVRRALALMKHDKLIRVQPHEEAAKTELVKDWITGNDVKECIMLAGTREDVLDLNLRAQAERAKRAQIKLPMFKKDGVWFRLLDRVLFRQNDSLLDVRNGTCGTLVAFNPDTRIATVKRDDGKRVFIPIDRYHKWELGYCLTVHQAQGTTCQKCYIWWAGTMQSREMTYVQASRARLMTRFYITEAQAGENFRTALQQMERSVAKELAHTKAREVGIDLSPSF
jgi:conjugative relaxase-like TrwC/TraI family protein